MAHIVLCNIHVLHHVDKSTLSTAVVSVLTIAAY